jgi:uncharacterized protein
MKRFLQLSLVGLLVFAVLPNVFSQKAVPELWSLRVHDEAHILQQATIDQLEKDLKSYEDSTSNQIAILIVQSLDGDALESYSIRVVEKWKLGQKGKDNGVLLLIAVDDHKMRIEVGQGLEGVLTDAQCSRIIRNEIAPAFRRSEFDAGVTAGVGNIIKAIGGEYTADDISESSEMTVTDRILFGAFIYGVLGLFTLISVFVRGGAGWGIYAFLIPFYLVFGWIPFGAFTAGLWVTSVYAIVMGTLRIAMNYTPWGRSLQKKWDERSKKLSSSSRRSSWSGSSWSSGGGSSWSSSSSSGSSFSGGGGSFGGGGSSGGW